MSESENITVADDIERDTGTVGDTTHAESVEHEFNAKTWCSDLTLIVEDKELHVAKTILALVSPVFKAMFQGEYKEKYAEEMPLPEKKYADVIEFLQCIYPNILKPVTLKNVYDVLPLADEYQVTKLKADCESCLLTCLSKDISTAQLYDIIKKAKYFNLPRVYERGMEIAADQTYTELDNVENEVELSDDLKSDIRVRMLQNLDTKYKNTSRWNGTALALCKFLGVKAKEKELANQYMEGRVVGDWGSLCIRKPYNGVSINLNVDDISFTVKTKSDICIRALIECNDPGEYNLNCVGGIVVNNWMKGKEDIVKIGKQSFQSSNRSQRLSHEQELGTLENETAGFIYEGNINIDVFLFSVHEP